MSTTTIGMKRRSYNPFGQRPWPRGRRRHVVLRKRPYVAKRVQRRWLTRALTTVVSAQNWTASHDSKRDVSSLIALRFSSPFRTVVKELLDSVARCPFSANPRSLLSSPQRGKDHAVEISRAFSLKLCLNVESLICLSNNPFFGDKLFKNRFDG
jgi:hypothetical protein